MILRESAVAMGSPFVYVVGRSQDRVPAYAGEATHSGARKRIARNRFTCTSRPLALLQPVTREIGLHSGTPPVRLEEPRSGLRAPPPREGDTAHRSARRRFGTPCRAAPACGDRRQPTGTRCRRSGRTGNIPATEGTPSGNRGASRPRSPP